VGVKAELHRFQCEDVAYSLKASGLYLFFAPDTQADNEGKAKE
jgi:hypothetical protein